MTDTATQLSVYNRALRWLEERKLQSLTENREPRRYLDDEYQDAVIFCLQQGNWKHAMRFVQVNAEINQTPNFGYEFAFLKPDDWLSTYQIADNDAFNPLIRNLVDMNNYWYTDITPIYARYVSSDARFGWNTALWREGFKEYLAAYLAQLVVPRLKQAGDKIDRVDKALKRIKIDALAKDAFSDPPGQRPYDTWVTSRAPRGSVVPYGSPFPFSTDD